MEVERWTNYGGVSSQSFYKSELNVAKNKRKKIIRKKNKET